ncbi:hypothetical protein QWA68_013802 [Fusarium oxysporum]|nr:hypothetical protein QWA68_013802 [Fusarium oxysporum]
MDVAPLQLYDSALIFTPQLSKIKECFNQEINKSIDVFSPNFQRWDACLQTIPGIAHKAMCEFSPDGGHVATINSNADSLLLMDASTGCLVKSIESPGGRLVGFTFYPSGDHLVTLSGETRYEAKLSIFHLPNGECSKSFTVPKSRRSAILSVSPDGKLLAIASGDHTVDIWHMASETKTDSCHIMLGSFVKYIAWTHTLSHPQALLILGSDDISIWGLDTTHQTSKLMSLTGIEQPDAATVSRDRTCCAVFQGWKELVLYSWGSSITVQKIARFDRTKFVFDASWVADDHSIALCGDFGIELWDLEAKKLVAQVRGDQAKIICYGRNRQLASLGLRNGTLKIWSLDTILSHSEPTTQQPASIVEAFITSPSGKVAIISNNAKFDMLSIAVDGRFHHLPKTLQNYYRSETLAFGHDDYFAVATHGDAIDVFNFDHDTGLYYCERRIGECPIPEFTNTTIQFWGQELIISYDYFISCWDLKSGKYLRKVKIPYVYGFPRSTITADGRFAVGEKYSRVVVIWDIMCEKETQLFDLQLDVHAIWQISLDSSGMLAISARDLDQNFITIGNAKDGTWIRRYSLLGNVPTLTFLTPKPRLDTGFGVLEYDMERGNSKDIPTVTAEGHWDPRYLRLFYSKSEAWLMKVNSVMSTVEINDAVFCQEHLAEICEDCSVDLREENDAFYGFDSVERDAIESPHASINDDGVYMCKKHDSATCNQCFGWKKKITKARMDAKKAGRA